MDELAVELVGVDFGSLARCPASLAAACSQVDTGANYVLRSYPGKQRRDGVAGSVHFCMELAKWLPTRAPDVFRVRREPSGIFVAVKCVRGAAKRTLEGKRNVFTLKGAGLDAVFAARSGENPLEVTVSHGARLSIFTGNGVPPA